MQTYLVKDLVHGIVRIITHASKFDGGVELDSTGILHFEIDAWRLLVQTQSHGLQLTLQNLAMVLLLLLSGIQNHENKIGTLGDGNNLSSTTTSICSSLDNTGKIQQLNAATLVVHVAGNAGQRGELVRSLLRLGIGKVASIKTMI